MKKFIALIALIAIVTAAAFADPALVEGTTGVDSSATDNGAKLDVNLTVTPKYEIGFKSTAVNEWKATAEAALSSVILSETTGKTSPETFYAYFKTTDPKGYDLKLKASTLVLAGGSETIAYTCTAGTASVTPGGAEVVIFSDEAATGLSKRGESVAVTVAATPAAIQAATAGSYNATLSLTIAAK